MNEAVLNKKWDDERFFAVRAEVLAQWPTGRDADLEEAAAYQHSLGPGRKAALLLQKAKETGNTLVQPRAGVANFEGQRQLLQMLDAAGSDILPCSVDSYTRNLRFADAQKGIETSTPEKSALNGFPIVSYGVKRCRELVESFEKPLHCRANATDMRLLAEIALASGFSGFVSGPMYSTLEYSKEVSLEESIRNWQYIFRLLGHYADRGVPLTEDSIGFSQAGTYSVPSLMHAGVVIECLMMAEQGIRNVIPYAMNQGALAQDIAACLAIGQLVEEYLSRFGYDKVNVYTASNHWNGAFPADESYAAGLISINTAAAAFARVPLQYVKSVQEAFGVPSKAANAQSVRITKQVIRMLRGQTMGFTSAEVQQELDMNLRETRAIVDKVLEMGDGDVCVGSIRAFEAGVLDVPMSPSRLAKNQVLPVRDAHGAVRYMDPGGLPIPKDCLEFHRERIREREALQGRPVSYESVVDDIEFLSTI